MIVALAALVLLLPLIGVSSCGVIEDGSDSEIGSEELFAEFEKLIQRQSFDDVSLAIYYVNEDVLTLIGYTVEQLIRVAGSDEFTGRIIVFGNATAEKMGSFDLISKKDLVPLDTSLYDVDARVYYIFRSAKDGKLLDVTIGGSPRNGVDTDVYCDFVNGRAVKENRLLFQIIVPFLTDDARRGLSSYLD